MQRHTVRAGFGLAVALFAWSAIRTDPHQPVCTHPVERANVNGHTRAVSCQNSGTHGSLLHGPARRLFGYPVDLNCSDRLTIETLSGIGPVRAQAIVDERSHRRFEYVDDLTRVRGIGPKTLSRLRSHLTVGSDGVSVGSPDCRRDPQSLGRPGQEQDRRHRA